jgi:hypothetical protein
MQKPKLKIILALALLLGLALSLRFWNRHREIVRTDAQIQALCQSLLDPETDLDLRCTNAGLLRPFADPTAKAGSPRMRGWAQMAVAVHILAHCSGLEGELLAAYLNSAGQLLGQALQCPEAQVAQTAQKGLSLLPQLQKAPMDSDAVFDALATAKLLPPPPGGNHAPQNREIALAILNQDSRKFSAGAKPGDAPLSTNPSFDGGGAKLLFEAFGKQFGLQFKPVGQLPKQRHYVAALQDFGLLEAKEHPLTGLSGDAVTQDNALLQLALRVNLPGTSPEQNAAPLSLFNQALKYFEEAKAIQFADWIAQKERVALLEPDHPFYAQQTIESTLITLRYRPGDPGVSRPCFSADFEEQSYFQWLLSQLPEDATRAGR